MSHSNRLLHEKSPYLLQHANNPVDWYPWGEEAFDKARREDKPLFLSVGYSTCHWCHVMERESFENEKIATLMNEEYVAIKVDREERPDIDLVYMEAVQAMTGRGGWPMSAFLLPDARPFYGGTYFRPEEFTKVLKRVAQMYRQERGKVEEAAAEVVATVASMAGIPPRGEGVELGPQLVKRTLEVLHRQFDAEHGGFGTAPKFPPHTALPLLLHEYRQGNGEGLLGMVTRTLEAMALGGIHDHVGGGFHRYSTDERWFLPHFEKMLYDNALLARNYVAAYAITGDQLYRETAERVFEWVVHEMTSPEGGFCTALDAESEGVEGKFYLWRREEIAEALGELGAQASRLHIVDLFCDLYNVTPNGNYVEEATGAATGENVLYLQRRLEELAQEHSVEPAELEARVARAREKLLEVRGRRAFPHRDDKVITSWNGLMIGSLAFAGRVLGQMAYTQAAMQAADFIISNLWSEGRLLRRWREGEAKIPSFLDDYMYLADGLLELHEATGEKAWLDRAREITEAAIAEFWDEREGGFFFTGEHGERLFVRPKEALDHPLPSGNGTAARVLLKLAEATGETRFREYAERTLRAFVSWMQRAPFGTQTLALATVELLEKR